MEADLSQPPPSSSSPARTTPTRPSTKRSATAASTAANDERTRRRKEWDHHGADLTWNWIEEKDMKVLAEVSSTLQRAWKRGRGPVRREKSCWFLESREGRRAGGAEVQSSSNPAALCSSTYPPSSSNEPHLEQLDSGAHCDTAFRCGGTPKQYKRVEIFAMLCVCFPRRSELPNSSRRAQVDRCSRGSL